MSKSKVSEGSIKKGGVNQTYQISERPPDPPPMDLRINRPSLKELGFNSKERVYDQQLANTRSDAKKLQRSIDMLLREATDKQDTALVQDAHDLKRQYERVRVLLDRIIREYGDDIA